MNGIAAFYRELWTICQDVMLMRSEILQNPKLIAIYRIECFSAFVILSISMLGIFELFAGHLISQFIRGFHSKFLITHAHVKVLCFLPFLFLIRFSAFWYISLGIELVVTNGKGKKRWRSRRQVFSSVFCPHCVFNYVQITSKYNIPYWLEDFKMPFFHLRLIILACILIAFFLLNTNFWTIFPSTSRSPDILN